MSYVGDVFADVLRWPKNAPYTHSTPYRQSGRPGVGHILGPSYSDRSIITTEHFLSDMTDEDALLVSCSAQCGDLQTISEDVATGGSIDTDNVFVESYVVKSCGSCSSLLGTFHCVIDWTVYTPQM